ncbi:MAG: hypothetical protein IKJ09_10825 [Bacteroidaceae bacterium]|nr:hypothetical protein [Bacteroidaceae bacterium]
MGRNYNAFTLFYKAKLFTVRERPRCSSRTTALPFANSSAALREQQMTSSNGIKENAIFVEERGK